MNKKVMWAGVAVVVVVAILGAVMFMSKNAGNKTVGTSEKNQVKTTPRLASFRELKNSTTPQECSYDEKSVAQGSTGVLYISNNKMRGDFQSTSNGKIIKSHIIFDNQYNYVWMDNSLNGIKMLSNSQNTDGSKNPSGIDEDTKIDYTCQDWSEDAGVFKLPENVKFQDISAAPSAIKPVAK